MIIRDLSDIDTYNLHVKSPYLVTAQIARFWLKFFDNKVSDQAGFLKAIDGKTLCATFVDKKESDLLVLYERPALIFHAIVENEAHDTTCIPPDQSYAFFQKWGIDTAPLTCVGDFDSFDEMKNSLVEVHRAISDSLIKDEELGAVVYFVQKGDSNNVLSMAKIETKESLCFLYLVKVLRDFWKSRENINAWNAKLDNEYNVAFQTFMQYLESLSITDFEGYMVIAQTAYKLIKEDMELYNKLKVDIPKFLSVIYKKLGYSAGAFKSSVLNYEYEESDHSSREPREEVKEGFQDEQIEAPRKEDAIDRLMKNEYIRKNSKINYEEQSLEDIIGSQKKHDNIKTPAKTKNKKKKKKKTKGEKKADSKIDVVNTRNGDKAKDEKPAKVDEEHIDIQAQAVEELVEENEIVVKHEVPVVVEHEEPVVVEHEEPVVVKHELEASVTTVTMI
jgi:hypothetical protein